MTTTTISLEQSLRRSSTHSRTIADGTLSTSNYNSYGILSCALSLIFVMYFFVPKLTGISTIVQAGLTLLFIIIIPIVAFTLALLSLRSDPQTLSRGAIPSYVALSITSLYFMTILAIPIILVGCYVLYAYIF